MKKLIISIGFICSIGLLACATWYYFFTEQVIAPLQLEMSSNASELRELKEGWKKMIQKEGGEIAYANFVEQALQSPVSTHEHAHAFGEALYEVEGFNGLRACDSSFEFGCYHSFFGLAVQDEGIGSLPKFDEACRTKYGNYNLPCQHGIGHGILVYTDYNNLVRALELCETISSLPTGGCSSGVFMEYNFHSMDENVDGVYVRTQGTDLYEPCSILPDRFQASCYNEQVQWWQNIFNSDFEYIGKLCQSLPAHSDTSEACFHGMGNYIAAEVELDPTEIHKKCLLIEKDDGQALCHEGASWLVRGDGSGIDKAQAVCSFLSGTFKESCLEKLSR